MLKARVGNRVRREWSRRLIERREEGYREWRKKQSEREGVQVLKKKEEEI